MSDPEASVAPPSTAESERVFRWLNFGSCTLRLPFDVPEFSKSELLGMPLQVNKIWRREVSAVLGDWEVAEANGWVYPSSLFADAWLSSRSVFLDADVILVDLALDISQGACLRFRQPGEAAGRAYGEIISNFPEEPPAELADEIQAFPCGEAISVAAWEKFGNEIPTPTVFITYEHRDDIKEGYPAAFRQRLLDYQAAVQALSSKFPHWMFISQDDLFAPYGTDCYVDRHHTTELGTTVIREEVPRLIVESGLLGQDVGGPPLPTGARFVPERCDFTFLNSAYLGLLADLGWSSVAVGPTRLTSVAQAAFGVRPLVAHTSFTPLSKEDSPALLMVLRWSQPVDIPAPMISLMGQHPDSIIELPGLWNGREKLMFAPAEIELRDSLRKFAASQTQSAILLPDLPLLRSRYLQRCLVGSHLFSAETGRLEPRATASSAAEAAAIPTVLAERLAADDLVPLFSPYF